MDHRYYVQANVDKDVADFDEVIEVINELKEAHPGYEVHNIYFNTKHEHFPEEKPYRMSVELRHEIIKQPAQ